jgi:sigma-B regulation protein RsbU (phosphoserine phosphatase)
MLGILPAARYEQARCDVRSGDVLVLYSDGLIEATSPAGEEHGERRLRESLATVGAGCPDDIRDAILASASALLGPAPPRDDVALVVAKSA